MRPAVVVFGAIGTIKIAAVSDVKAALQRLPVEETLTRFQNVIAGKFTADFAKKLHAMMKEHLAYDNLLAKQLRRGISLHHVCPRGTKQLHRNRPPNRLAHTVNHTFGGVCYRLVSFRQEFGQNREVLHRILCTFRIVLNIDDVGRRMHGKILLEGAPGAG